MPKYHVKNLAQLKRLLRPGAQFKILAHDRPECVGQIREVNIANTVGVYTFIPGQPETKNMNRGRGRFMQWGKSCDWEFGDEKCTQYISADHNPDTFVLTLQII